MNKQIENFVNNWFSDLDQLKEEQCFLERLDENFEFNIYGTILQGHKGFLSIYAGMQANTSSIAHHIASNIRSKVVKEDLYQVDFHIALENTYPNGDTTLSESEEQWFVRNLNGKLIIEKYEII
ncbi:MAG: hypothetical protein N4A49_02545 [Marinifilaceae bacterium]|jgi:hypothetical protein|nr:hypothetical protein [Marinifilaceae bacterium]